MPEMSALRQLLAEAVGHGAEVLADHHALVALALERDLADQFVDGIGDIGAVRGLGALGDHEQPRQAHRVVDAQHAGVAHVGGEQLAEALPAGRARRRRDRAAAGASSGPVGENVSGGAPTVAPMPSSAARDQLSAPSGAEPTARSR